MQFLRADGHLCHTTRVGRRSGKQEIDREKKKELIRERTLPRSGPLASPR